MQPTELRRLLGKYIDQTISEEEFHLLWETLQERKYDPEWNSIIEETFSNTTLHTLPDTTEAGRRLKNLHNLIEKEQEPYLKSGEEKEIAGELLLEKKPEVRFIAKHIFRYAAILILILAPLVYFFTKSSAEENSTITAIAPVSPETIKPGTQKALLTLADGTVITLDSAANGMIAEQGKTQVVKLSNGQIKYQANGVTGEEGKIVYNTMSTPRGGQYQLTLPDGSNIWLNAESSITYPAVFIGNERKVVITGEVYFEVAKDKNKPFHVVAGDQEIEVLGTHFNINAYSDEGRIKTSLLEGSVKVNKQILKPGQAFMNNKVGQTNVDQDVAWKNGVFNFNNQTLSQVMRQLARWYNLEVVYPSGIPKKEYGGEIGRNLTLDQVLKGLEQAGIHFQLEGRKLMVKI